jgi:cell shape-determining protein MreC
MTTPNSNQLLAAVALILLVMCMLPAQVAGKVAHPVSSGVRFIVSPISTWLHGAGVAVRARPEPIGLAPSDSEALREELDKVWQYNRRLEQELQDARKTIQHLGHMRQMMPDTQTDLVVGRVIGTSLATPSPSLTLDIGVNHGMRPGLAVVSGFNLVGQVTEALPQRSLVKPITAPDTLLNLRLVPAAAGEPTREAFVSARAVAGLFVGTVGANEPIKIGDLAHLYDEAWPPEARGFVVGQVVALDPLERDPLLRKKIKIEPLRSPTALDRVVVLLPTETDRTSKPAPQAPVTPLPPPTNNSGKRVSAPTPSPSGGGLGWGAHAQTLNATTFHSDPLSLRERAGVRVSFPDSDLLLTLFDTGLGTLDAGLPPERRG